MDQADSFSPRQISGLSVEVLKKSLYSEKQNEHHRVATMVR
ncbi:hypothetical protein PHOSAC3_140131 [Mesotoga infera]|nr:hypothetical protein PHOSAC3_140131 [Mesotoga infera]